MSHHILYIDVEKGCVQAQPLNPHFHLVRCYATQRKSIFAIPENKRKSELGFGDHLIFQYDVTTS